MKTLAGTKKVPHGWRDDPECVGDGPGGARVGRDPNWGKRNLFYVRRDSISYQEGMEMAKPIELGLVLEGEDARRFQRYLDHPTDTDDGRELIREAAILAREMRL